MEEQIYWIHCNKCSEMFSKKKQRFAILGCSHIFCEKCLTSTYSETKSCHFCKKKVSGKWINSEMDATVKRYFVERPWENFAYFDDVVPFQLRQRKHFSNVVLKYKQQYAIEKKKFDNAKEKYATLEKISKKLQLAKEVLAEEMKEDELKTD